MELLNLRFFNPEFPSVERKEPSFEWENVIIKFEIVFKDEIDAKNIIQNFKDNYIEDNLIAKYEYDLQSIQAKIVEAEKQVTVTVAAEKSNSKWGNT